MCLWARGWDGCVLIYTLFSCNLGTGRSFSPPLQVSVGSHGFQGRGWVRDAAGRLELEELVRLVLLGLESNGSSHSTSWANHLFIVLCCCLLGSPDIDLFSLVTVFFCLD